MLNGREVTELKLTEVLEENPIFRIESDYFQKRYLQNELTLKSKSWKFLKDSSESIKSFGAYSLCNEVAYLERGIPFLRGQNILDGVVSFDDCLYIDAEANKLLWKSEVKLNMVLLTMSGTIGNCAVAMESWKYPINSNQDIAKITLAGNLNPHYVCTFINCKHGQLQMKRIPVGSVQQHTFIWQLEKLVIPILSEKFQNKISELFKQAHEKLEESKTLYARAENLLLDNLGLHSFISPTENTTVKSYRASFLQTDRLDAEYYHPEKVSMLDWLDKFQGKSIGHYVSTIEQLIDPTKGFSSELVSNFDLTDALEIYLANKQSIPTYELGSTKKQMKKGDIAISRLRSYLKEIAIVDTPEEVNVVGSSEFIVLRPNHEAINAESLLVYLRSLPVQKILKWCQSGSNHPRFMEKDLLAIKIPDNVLALRQTLQINVREAIGKSRESKRLLEIAKRAVEIAIEENEQAAFEFIKTVN